MKSAAYYKRQAQEAEARDTFFRNKPATTRPNGSAVNQKNLGQAFYNSLFIKEGTDHVQFRVSVDTVALGKVGGVNGVGLTTAGTAGKLILPVKNILLPTLAQWYSGTATPTVKITAWGSVSTKYYDTVGTGAEARSHYSVPLSSTGATFELSDIVTKFNTLFQGAAGASGNVTLLGAKNGRASLRLERVTQAFNT